LRLRAPGDIGVISFEVVGSGMVGFGTVRFGTIGSGVIVLGALLGLGERWGTPVGSGSPFAFLYAAVVALLNCDLGGMAEKGGHLMGLISR